MAVLRSRKDTVEALLAAGFPVGEESERGWLALEVAVEAEDRPMVKVWHSDNGTAFSLSCASLATCQWKSIVPQKLTAWHACCR